MLMSYYLWQPGNATFLAKEKTTDGRIECGINTEKPLRFRLQSIIVKLEPKIIPSQPIQSLI